MTKLRLTRMVYNGKPIEDPSPFMTIEQARELRLSFTRNPCPCHGLDDALLTADIDIIAKMPTSWQIALCPNDYPSSEDETTPYLWTSITHCPVCGRPLPVVQGSHGESNVS